MPSPISPMEMMPMLARGDAMLCEWIAAGLMCGIL